MIDGLINRATAKPVFESRTFHDDVATTPVFPLMSLRRPPTSPNCLLCDDDNERGSRVTKVIIDVGKTEIATSVKRQRRGWPGGLGNCTLLRQPATLSSPSTRTSELSYVLEYPPNSRIYRTKSTAETSFFYFWAMMLILHSFDLRSFTAACRTSLMASYSPHQFESTFNRASIKRGFPIIIHVQIQG